jgi:hypothetical protein
MTKINAFMHILQIEPLYETEPTFFEPFWNFMYRFQSLHRHWELSREYFELYLSDLGNEKGDGSAEFATVYSETAGIDQSYFPEYLRLSTISFSLSLVENLLSEIAENIATESGKTVDLDSRPLPNINKYILWLTRNCGIEIEINKDEWKRLDAIRELRNRFIHKIDRDIPEQVKREINQMVSVKSKAEALITDELVENSLKSLGSLVKKIELSYINHYDQNAG